VKQEILDVILRFVEHDLPLREFQERFGALYFRARSGRNRSREVNAICNEVIVLIAEHSRGHRSEDSLRQELANAMRPFAPQWEMPSPGRVVLRSDLNQKILVATYVSSVRVVRMPPKRDELALGTSAMRLSLGPAAARA
jgi:hypothetical protein